MNPTINRMKRLISILNHMSHLSKGPGFIIKLLMIKEINNLIQGHKQIHHSKANKDNSFHPHPIPNLRIKNGLAHSPAQQGKIKLFHGIQAHVARNMRSYARTVKEVVFVGPVIAGETHEGEDGADGDQA
jgi:hypothetical protein